MGVLLALFASHPAALIPPGVNPDSPALRIGLIAFLAGLAVVGAVWGAPPLIASVLLVAAAIMVYWMPPALGGDSQYLRLPSAFCLSLLALPVIGGLRFLPKRGFAVSLAVYMAAVVWALLADPSGFRATIGLAGHMLIPLAFALLAAHGRLRRAAVVGVAAGLWLLLVVYGLLNYGVGFQVGGIALNRNWMACALLALWPWAAYAVGQGLPAWAGGAGGRFAVGLAASSAPCLFLLYQCRSRAAWLALAAAMLLALFHALPRRWWLRLGFCLAVVLGVLAIMVLHTQETITAMREDVRLPLWRSTSRLILDHPLAGIGPARFEEGIAAYQKDSPVHLRQVAAERTEHPHNVFLNLAAGLGLPAALAWLVLLWPLLRCWRGRPPTGRLAQFTAFIVVFQAMFDKPLVQPPSSIAGLCALGLCWQEFFRVDGGVAYFVASLRRRLLSGVAAALLLLLAMAVGLQEFRGGWYLRRGFQYSSHDEPAAAAANFRRAGKIAPHRVAAHYAAGSIALQRLRQPQAALVELEKAHRLNPNYAHVNKLLGRAHFALGDYARAGDFLARDLGLFKKDPGAYHWLYICQAHFQFAGKGEQMRRLEQQANVVYRERVSVGLTSSQARAAAEEWRQAVAGNDFARAHDPAATLLGAASASFPADPFFAWLTKSRPWPGDVVATPYMPTDFRYWRLQWRRAEVLAELLGANDGADAPFRQLFEAVAARTDVSAAAPPFEFPDTVWATGKGSALAQATVLAWLVDGAGYSSLISRQAGASAPLVVAFAPGVCYVMDVQAGRFSRLALPGTDPAAAALVAAGLPPGLGAAQVFAMPQSFFLKNQILAVLLQAQLGDHPYLRFDRLPYNKVYALVEQLRAFGYEMNIMTAVMPEPFEATAPAPE